MLYATSEISCHTSHLSFSIIDISESQSIYFSLISSKIKTRKLYSVTAIDIADKLNFWKRYFLFCKNFVWPTVCFPIISNLDVFVLSCARLGLTVLAFLWRRDQEDLLSEMCQCGLKAILIKVAALGKEPVGHNVITGATILVPCF